jgi:glycerate 2-kinase
MKIIIAPDSFKESLSASEVADAIEEGIRRVYPDALCVKIPMADGGEGTVESIVKATGGKIIHTKAFDPLMREINSFFGITGDSKTAIVEMAAASGLEKLTLDERNPMLTTSYGTGQLIAEALHTSVERIIIGLGGSATNDGGCGMAEALGIKFYDDHDNLIHPVGGNLQNINTIKTDQLNPLLLEKELMIATDVNNHLCGPQGASHIYGPQKGASKSMIDQLDKNLFYFGKLLEREFGRKIVDLPGSGAAGGLAVIFLAFTRAVIKPGFDIINEITGFEKSAKDADLIITGEGRIDFQTQFGKAPYKVLLTAKKFRKPVIAIAGSVGVNKIESQQIQFDAIVPITDRPCSLEDAIKNADELVRNTAERIMRLIFVGRGI